MTALAERFEVACIEEPRQVAAVGLPVMHHRGRRDALVSHARRAPAQWLLGEQSFTELPPASGLIQIVMVAITVEPAVLVCLPTVCRALAAHGGGSPTTRGAAEWRVG